MIRVLLALFCVFSWSQPPSPEAMRQLATASQQDHQQMMQQLGITRLRPGANGRAKAGEPGAANYDPQKANPYPSIPELLVLKNGRKVTNAAQWQRQRRAEIVEDLERELYGRIPANVPKVTWKVTETAEAEVAGRPVSAKRLTGIVDNSDYPGIAVEIQAVLVVPKRADKRVPVMIMFGFPRMPGEASGFNFPYTGSEPPSQDSLIQAGWAYATLNTASIQADNGAGLTKGIIGLVNRGQPRKPDDWGALRAWGWGASRLLDYLSTEPSIDTSKAGIEGVSRWGKAALVTMAFDLRVAVGLIASSGQGGVKLHRRNFGEQVENLTGSGAYHWMAGNYLKYGTAESSFGSKTANDLPVDAHHLIALCAPRLVFISYGIPEKGDALWLDQQGSFMAAVAAQPAWRLLGTRDLGVKQDYRTAVMPPVNTGLLDGQLAWRQHDGGHEDRTNMRHFLAWAHRHFGRN